MAKLMLLLFISILHYAICLPSCIRYPPRYDNKYPKTCAAGESLLSTEDIADMINFIADGLFLQDGIENSYLQQFEELNNKHLTEINQFHEQLVDRPKHMHHILEDMETKRRQLESVIDSVVAKKQDVDNQGETFGLLVERSNKVFSRLEMYKKMCRLNCEDAEFYERFDNSITLAKYPSSLSCWKIKDLFNNITHRLTVMKEEINKKTAELMEDLDKTCNEHIVLYKSTLKKAAIEQYGNVMYDVLSLQDDYYHFMEFLDSVNESYYSEDLNENIANIEQRLATLEGDVDEYGGYCMNCHNNVRSKRDILAVDTQDEVDSKILDDLIQEKFGEISEQLAHNISKIFEELRAHIVALQTQNLEADLLSELVVLSPDQIAYYIKREQEAFDRLKDSVSHSSLNRTKDLLEKSEEILTNLEKAKNYISNVRRW